MTIVCALSQSPLAAHQSAASGGERSGDGAAPDSVCLNLDGVTLSPFLVERLADQLQKNVGRAKLVLAKAGAKRARHFHFCSGGHGASRLLPALHRPKVSPPSLCRKTSRCIFDLLAEREQRLLVE